MFQTCDPANMQAMLANQFSVSIAPKKQQEHAFILAGFGETEQNRNH